MERKVNDKKQGIITALIGEKTPSKISGLTYTLSAFVFFLVAIAFSIPMAAAAFFLSEEGAAELSAYCSFLAAPVAFALMAVWYFSFTKTSVRGFFKEQKCSPKYYLIAVSLQIGLLSLGELNSFVLGFLGRFGYVDSGITLPSLDGFGFVGVLLVVAVLPAFMEELFFRGIFLREMKDMSTLARVLLCGALFSLYHQNPAQTVYQFLCGAAFAFVAVRAGSFLPTVLSHFINNAAIVVLYKLGVTEYPTTIYWIILAVSSVCLILSLILLFLDGRGKEKGKTKAGAFKQFFACAGVGIGIFALVWLSTLAMGFAGV